MSNFKTRRLPQSPQQMSSLTDLNEHIQNTGNPHPQYLLVDAYAGGGNGSIDLSGYLRTSTYNQYTATNEEWKTTHLASNSNPHTQYVLNSTYSSKIESIDEGISDLSGTVSDHEQTIADYESRIGDLEDGVGQNASDISGLGSRMTTAEGNIGSLESNKLSTTDFNTFFTNEYSVLQTNANKHITNNFNGDELNCHPQYVLKSVYDAEIEALEGLITGSSEVTGFFTTSDLVGKSQSDAPSVTNTNKPLAGYWGAYLQNQISDHTQSTTNVQNRYSQSYTGNIPLHLDNENKELYARRVHTHTPKEIGASPVGHNHDYEYLTPSDISYNRNVTAYAWINGSNIIYTDSNTPSVNSDVYSDRYLNSKNAIINAVNSDHSTITVGSTAYTRFTDSDNTILNITALKNLFASINHPHAEYETILPSLEERGIYPAAVLKEEKSSIQEDPNDPTQEIIVTEGQDLNKYIKHGEYYIKSSTYNSNMPFTDFEGFVKISSTKEQEVEYERDENTDVITVQTPGRTNIVQRARADKTGTEFSRFGYVIETVDAQDNTKLAKTYTYGSWKVTEAESVISSGDSTATYTANRESARTHIVTLNTNCTLTLSNMRVGETLELQVTTSGNKTLTFNSVVILSTADSGKFVCKFSNKTGTPQLDVIFAVLA